MDGLGAWGGMAAGGEGPNEVWFAVATATLACAAAAYLLYSRQRAGGSERVKAEEARASLTAGLPSLRQELERMWATDPQRLPIPADLPRLARRITFRSPLARHRPESGDRTSYAALAVEAAGDTLRDPVFFPQTDHIQHYYPLSQEVDQVEVEPDIEEERRTERIRRQRLADVFMCLVYSLQHHLRQLDSTDSRHHSVQLEESEAKESEDGRVEFMKGKEAEPDTDDSEDERTEEITDSTVSEEVNKLDAVIQQLQHIMDGYVAENGADGQHAVAYALKESNAYECAPLMGLLKLIQQRAIYAPATRVKLFLREEHGLMTKDTHGPDAWRIVVDFEYRRNEADDLQEVSVTHTRRERSSADAELEPERYFEVEWRIRLVADRLLSKLTRVELAITDFVPHARMPRAVRDHIQRTLEKACL